METIAKFIKAIFFGEDGEADKSAISKFKNYFIFGVVLLALTFGALIYFVDDDEEAAGESIEYVEEADFEAAD